MDGMKTGKEIIDGNIDTKIEPAGCQVEPMETTEQKSDTVEKKPTMQTSMGKKGDKSKVVQSRKHSVRSTLVKPLHIAKGVKVKEIERLLEDLLMQTLSIKETKEDSSTIQTETRLTKQDKGDKNRERRRIARAKRESLKDFQAPKCIIFGFSCVLKKINSNTVKAVLVDPHLPQNLLQILHPLALEKSIPIIGLEKLGLLTKQVLGFKVSALGLCDHPKSYGLYSKLLESILEVDTCQTSAQYCHYQKTNLE